MRIQQGAILAPLRLDGGDSQQRRQRARARAGMRCSGDGTRRRAVAAVAASLHRPDEASASAFIARRAAVPKMRE